VQIRSLTILLGVIVMLATAVAEEKPAAVQDEHIYALARTDFKPLPDNSAPAQARRQDEPGRLVVG